MQYRNDASITTGRELVQTTQLYDAVCECSLERWFRETPTRWTMLITTELATIVGDRCFRETHPDPRPGEGTVLSTAQGAAAPALSRRNCSAHS